MVTSRRVHRLRAESLDGSREESKPRDVIQLRLLATLVACLTETVM